MESAVEPNHAGDAGLGGGGEHALCILQAGSDGLLEIEVFTSGSGSESQWRMQMSGDANNDCIDVFTLEQVLCPLVSGDSCQPAGPCASLRIWIRRGHESYTTKPPENSKVIEVGNAAAAEQADPGVADS